jgi:hypothetical protein
MGEAYSDGARRWGRARRGEEEWRDVEGAGEEAAGNSTSVEETGSLGRTNQLTSGGLGFCATFLDATRN